jgi:cation transport ATPase
MENQSKVDIFIHQLQISTRHSLSYPNELSCILALTFKEGKSQLFEDLIFHAKFIVKTQEVMNRIGPKADGFEKIASEFQSSVKHATELLGAMVESSDQKDDFEAKIFSFETDSFTRLMKLFSDLSWIKNWQIDGKPLPYEMKSSMIIPAQENVTQQTKEEQRQHQSTKSITRILGSAVLGMILFVLFLLIDSPVTILGWILSLWIAALLVYIVIQILFFMRNKNSH